MGTLAVPSAHATPPAVSSADAAHTAAASAAPAQHAQAAATAVSGGDNVYSSGYRCTVGFNVRGGSEDYFLTAGHCASAGNVWYTSPDQTTEVGVTAGVTFPSSDHALVRYTNDDVQRTGTVGDVPITGVGNPTIGQQVCQRGGVSGVRCGQVTGLNQTVNFGNGQVLTGLISTNICSEPGDTGAPLYAGSLALGILIGGGNCSSFYIPLSQILAAYGVTLL
ncbi:S1 family peptidase [Streptomyces sp. TP-A0874]|uniref:S1 family peptidase n=1 Tax=Streptomyces sp. TP-A0874 TaxID=549819 RepID=UPI003F93A04E